MGNYTLDLFRYYLGQYSGELTIQPEKANISHLISVGLGPIAYWILRKDSATAQPDAQIELRSADLTARVLHGQLRKSIKEILEVLQDLDCRPVLLKGASLADQVYREPHHRIMGDVDILVQDREASRAARLLQSAGYLPLPASRRTPLSPDHHHLPELRKESTRVSVEIHTRLFSRSRHAALGMHQPQAIWQEVRKSDFDGVMCLRLRAEYEIAYTVTHWAIDRRWCKNAVNLLDVALLVNTYNELLDWPRLIQWMDSHPSFSEVAAITLGYLDHYGLIAAPPSVADRIQVLLKKTGHWNTGCLYWLIDNFPLSENAAPKSRILTASNAQVAWRAMLEPRTRMTRLPVATSRVLIQRKEGKSFLGSLGGRLQTLLAPRR